MRTLDFLVLGTQKAGTTTLHLMLSQHPDLWLPPEKEAPYFSDDHTWTSFNTFLDEVYGDAPRTALWGGVNPQYMRGEPGVPVAEVAKRAATHAPNAKLVAVLRDPIDRAVSEWRMASRRGQEHRGFEHAVEEQLAHDALRCARLSPEPNTSYVVQGEYGRILSEWCRHFPRANLHVAFFDDLRLRPQALVDDLYLFLNVPTRLADPVPVAHRSGSQTKVSEQHAAQLRALLDRHVWPTAPSTTKRAFNYWFGMWNIVSDTDAPALSQRLRCRLQEHYREDTRTLQRLGIPAPWTANWA